jgi:hypothetical protein
VPALYRGIELVYRGVVSGMESDFLVAPDADPEQIRMRFSGARQVTINNDGTLVVSGLRGEVRQSKPVAYQDM